MRLLVLLAVLPLAFASPDSLGQAKTGGGAMRVPTAKDPSVAITAYMRDGGKNELLVATRVWPEYPEYNAMALQRFFAMMKAMEPAYRKDDDVAYSWLSTPSPQSTTRIVPSRSYQMLRASTGLPPRKP